MENSWRMFILTLAGVMFCSAQIFANSYNIFGTDSRSIAMGNAYTTLATDPTGLYYNPAGIVNSTANTILELSYVYPFIDLNFKGKSISAQLYLDRAENVDRPYGFSIGGITRVATLLGNDLSFGVLVYISQGRNLISEKFGPENEPISFQFYEQPLTDIVLAGLGYKVNKYISIGAGVSILSDLNVTLKTDVLGDPFYGKSDGSLPLNFSPHIGLLFIAKNYRIGISYRGEKSARVISIVDDKLSGVIKQEVTILNSPAQTTVGVSYRFSNDLTISGDLTFVDWSNYTPPWLEVVPEGGGIAGEQIKPLTASKAGLKDRMLPKVGIEYTMFNQALGLRCGYIFRQSPVPDQSGTSNLIDSDTHIISLGAGYGFTIMDVPKAIEIDFHFQYHLMTERDTVKYDETNPAYPGFTASGNVYNAGVTLKFNFKPPERKESTDEI